MSNQIAAGQVDVILDLAFAVLQKNGKVYTLLGHHCFQIPIGGRVYYRHGASYFTHYFTCWAHHLVHAGDESCH